MWIILTVFSYHVTHAFQSESTLYICLNVKQLFAWSKREIWSLNGCNRTRTHNHLVHERTLNHLGRWSSVHLWTKWLWVRVQLRSLWMIQVPCNGRDILCTNASKGNFPLKRTCNKHKHIVSFYFSYSSKSSQETCSAGRVKEISWWS